MDALHCVVCGNGNTKSMMTNLPCNHSGCKECIVSGSICHFCKQPFEETVPNRLIPYLVPDTDDVDDCKIYSCSSCLCDAVDNCVSCNELFCEDHAEAHKWHTIQDVCEYVPPSPDALCAVHRKPITDVDIYGKMFCRICEPAIDRHSVEDSEGSHRTFNNFLIEASEAIMMSIRECLGVGCSQINENIVSATRARRANALLLMESLLGENIDIEQDYKLLDCELMGVEDRLMSLRAVNRLNHAQFLKLTSTYSESLLSGMGISFSGIRVGGKTIHPMRIPNSRFRSVHQLAKNIDKVRLFGLQVAILSNEQLFCYDFRGGHSRELLPGARVIDIASCGPTLVVLLEGFFLVLSGASETFVGPTIVDREMRFISVGERYVCVASATRVACYTPDHAFEMREMKFSSSWTIGKKNRILQIRNFRDKPLLITQAGSKTIFLGNNLVAIKGVPIEDLCTASTFIGARDFALGTTKAVTYVKDHAGWYVEPSSLYARKMNVPGIVSCDVSLEYPLAIFSTPTEILYNFF
jgi:hypothetical protein